MTIGSSCFCRSIASSAGLGNPDGTESHVRFWVKDILGHRRDAKALKVSGILLLLSWTMPRKVRSLVCQVGRRLSHATRTRTRTVHVWCSANQTRKAAGGLADSKPMYTAYPLISSIHSVLRVLLNLFIGFGCMLINGKCMKRPSTELSRPPRALTKGNEPKPRTGPPLPGQFTATRTRTGRRSHIPSNAG